MTASPLAAFPRHRFAHLPTPLVEAPRLAAAIRDRVGQSPRLLVKRDDCTGLALGGNKTRKLEFLVGAALAEGADTLVSTGAIQSNHARQTAAAAAVAGLHCSLVLFDMVAQGGEAYHASGNVLLDHLLGAEVEIVPGDALRAATFERLFARLEARGRKPYFVPMGGSSLTGSLGYVDAYDELRDQLNEASIQATRLIHATSSGGTQAGLMAGAALYPGGPRVEGVNVYRADNDAMARDVAAQALETASALGVTLAGDALVLHDGLLGDGYGLPTEAMREAISLAARTEGLLLDPVYTGKAMAGLIALIADGMIGADETVIFLHTGGVPGLFAYPRLFTP